jgi:hypothetical protein
MDMHHSIQLGTQPKQRIIREDNYKIIKSNSHIAISVLKLVVKAVFFTKNVGEERILAMLFAFICNKTISGHQKIKHVEMCSSKYMYRQNLV